MSKINLTFGTKNFLKLRMTKNSILAYNSQYHEDYLLITPVARKNAVSKNTWLEIPTNEPLQMTKQFYLSFLELSSDNQSLLIHQIDELPQSNLYQKNDQQSLLVITQNSHILTSVSHLLKMPESALNASLSCYLKV